MQDSVHINLTYKSYCLYADYDISENFQTATRRWWLALQRINIKPETKYHLNSMQLGENGENKQA